MDSRYEYSELESGYYKISDEQEEQWLSVEEVRDRLNQVEAIQSRLIEVEDMAAWYQQQHQQLVAEREALQARVRELEEQVSNSIPKPVVEVNGMNGNYDVRINGVMFAWYSLDSWGSDLDARAAAIAKREQFIQALGMGGGGDE